MAWPLDPKLKTPLNRDVLAFILSKNPSAHSDVASALTDCAKGLSGFSRYCPDLHAYAYFALHTQATYTIFALAYGMTAIAYRLPESTVADCISTKRASPSEIGKDWIGIRFTDDGITGEVLHAWCKAALEYAASLRAK